jgi:hypothetical protein
MVAAELRIQGGEVSDPDGRITGRDKRRQSIA